MVTSQASTVARRPRRSSPSISAGSGTAELTFTTSTMRYTQPEVAYVFSAASPVPEPASAVLVVTGIAALGGRKMLRLRTHRSR